MTFTSLIVEYFAVLSEVHCVCVCMRSFVLVRHSACLCCSLLDVRTLNSAYFLSITMYILEKVHQLFIHSLSHWWVVCSLVALRRHGTLQMKRTRGDKDGLLQDGPCSTHPLLCQGAGNINESKMIEKIPAHFDLHCVFTLFSEPCGVGWRRIETVTDVRQINYDAVHAVGFRQSS